MKRFVDSISVRLSLKFMIILTAAVISLAIAFVVLVNSIVRSSQDLDLKHVAANIEKDLEKIPADRMERLKKWKKARESAKKISEDEKKSGFGDGSGELDERKDDFLNPPKQNENRPIPFPMVPYYISFSVSDSSGKVIFTNDPFLPEVPETNGSSERLIRKNYFIDGDLNILYFSKKITLSDGEYSLVTAMDMTRDSSFQLYRSLPKSIMLAIIPILLASFFISYMITSRTMKPVVQVTKAASRISSSNLGVERLSESNHDDEINDLIMTFNNLFDRLKVDFDREKQFTSDVSHELKTPIAVILGQTNLLLRWGKDDAAQLEKSLTSIKKETKSMEAIITNLLQISRLERGKIKPNAEKVHVGEMFQRLKDEFLAVSPSLSISFEPSESDFDFVTDSELLHQVLTVVVSNSVKYAGDKCCISFRALKGMGMTIEIEDDGPGFAENVLPHVFERFYRGDEAHTRSVGGSGLGLSIARVIVESLGGRIFAYNTATHGAGIKIVLMKN